MTFVKHLAPYLRAPEKNKIKLRAVGRRSVAAGLSPRPYSAATERRPTAHVIFGLRAKRPLARFSVCLAALLALSAAYAAAAKEEPEIVSTICVEAETGMVLAEENAAIVRPPASMIKMIQMLLVTEGLYKNSWTLETPIHVSLHAQKMGGTQVYLEAGETWTLGELMPAIAVASANDAAMAVAEGLWGSEEKYLEAVNARAKELGMASTEFHSVHGLPPDAGEEPDGTTARDMATLGRACVAYPYIMRLVGAKELQFRPEEAIKHNTNKLLWRMEDCDGIKTGYIRASGFCVTATAQRDGIRLIGVVMGCKNGDNRFKIAKEMLEAHFADVKRVNPVETLLKTALPEMVPVQNSPVKNVRLVPKDEDISLVLRAGDVERIEMRMDVPDSLVAPLAAGIEAGSAAFLLDGKEIARTALLLPVALEELPWRSRTWNRVTGWFGFGE